MEMRADWHWRIEADYKCYKNIALSVIIYL